MKNRIVIYALIIILSSLATHFAFFGYPSQTVFDEVHFGKFISGYLTGEYFFDIHPPLGKLLITGFGYLSGFRPGFEFTEIGKTFPDWHYKALRFLPTLAGALLALVFFGVALQLKISPLSSFLGGILISLENALITQSRFILLDSFLLLFGLSAVYFYFRYLNRKEGGTLKPRYLWATGIFIALAGSIKWTGFGFGLTILVLEIFRLWPGFNLLKFRKNHHLCAKTFWLALVAVPALVYISFFALHFKLLPQSGTGDAFMSIAFRKTLVGAPEYDNPDIQPAGFIKKFAELNSLLYAANQRITANHPYSSAFYTWPLMARPVYYWNQTEANSPPDSPPKEARLYLLGNPFIWWSSTLAMAFILIYSVYLTLRKKTVNKIFGMVSLGYLLNLLPFVFISRVMFLYHYFPSLLFAVLGLLYLIDKNAKRKELVISALVAAAVFFLYFSPLTYGFSLPSWWLDKLAWLPTWR